MNIGLKKEAQLLRLDLQFFAEGDHQFAAEPTPQEPHPFAEEPQDSPFAQYTDQPNPLTAPDTPQLQSQDQGQQAVEGQQVEGQQPQDQEQYLDFSGRKVKAYGEDVVGLHQDYMELNRTYQQTNQELQMLRQQQAMSQQQAMQQQAPQQPQSFEQQPSTSHTQQVDPARIQQLNEEYMERMYENKYEADQWWAQQPEVQQMEQQRLQSLVQSQVDEIVGPIQQERQIQQELHEVRQRYSDFDAYADKISEIVSVQPHLAEVPNALETLYLVAKGQQAPAPDQLLLDPSFQQQIVQNEQIRNMILQNYQQLKTDSAPPHVMGSGSAQVPSSLGENKPRSIAEATAAFLKFSGGR